jgi:transposase
VRLSQGQTFEEGRGRAGQEAKRRRRCHLLRREAGYLGHRHNATRFAAGARRARDFAREHECERHGTVALMAGINLLTGKVRALVKDRHHSREFIEFLKLLDTVYPPHTQIHWILDNHSAHISKETRAWLADQPAGRFEFTFTPKHGSWLNLVEGFFSKLARSGLRHIRVSSKQELKDRLMAAMDFFNRGARGSHLDL